MVYENSNEQGQDLENKISFAERAKYMAGGALLTAGLYFGPNMKRAYNNLPQEKKDTVKSVAYAGTTIFGTILAATSGYKWFKNNKEKKQR